MPKAFLSTIFQGYFSQPLVMLSLFSFGPTSDFRWYLFFSKD